MKAVDKRQKQAVSVKRGATLFIRGCLTLVHIFESRFFPSISQYLHLTCGAVLQGMAITTPWLNFNLRLCL